MQIAVCFSLGSVLVEGHLDLRVLSLLVLFHQIVDSLYGVEKLADGLVVV